MVDQNPKIIGSDALLNLMTPFFGSTYANNFIKNLLINFRKENDLNPDQKVELIRTSFKAINNIYTYGIEVERK